MPPSVRSGGGGREGREQRRAECVDLGDARAAGGLGEQLAAHPLTGHVRAGPGVAQRRAMGRRTRCSLL